jgi:hypothetical protein
VASVDIPAKWCDAHHCDHWAHGGDTSLTNTILTCKHHHMVIHIEDCEWIPKPGGGYVIRR